jgi:S1-C subfamily serine protease
MKPKAPWLLLILVFALTAMSCNLLSGTATSAPPTRTPQERAANTPTSVATQPVISPSNNANQPEPLPDLPIDLEYQDSLLTRLYELVNPGIVSIQVLSEEGGSLGSGFIFDQEGHVITNYHVVQGAQDLEVDFPSGLKVRGEVIGTDLDSDIAVIKIDAPADELFPLVMGNSDALKVGQTVVAIGNPFGLTGTMTLGIVSAQGRTLGSFRTTPDGNSFTAGGIIQTDAAINPGNSGGPLLNLKGEVVGVNRAIQTTSSTIEGEPTNSGVGFAIPVNIVKRVVPQLIETGVYDYPYLGVTSRDEISLIEQEMLGLSQSSGAYVLSVTPDGPADQAGLRGGSTPTEIPGLNAGGDIIIAVDGRPVRVFGDLLSYLMSSKSPGDTLVVTIVRGTEQKEVTITLGKRP